MSIHIHVINTADMRMDDHLLDDREVTRAASFYFAEDARYWSSCRAALRVVLGRFLSLAPQEVPLEVMPNGKPCLAHPFSDTHFNLSHCRDLLLIAIAPSPVGIDVESTSRANDLLGCEESFCHPREIALLPQEPCHRASILLEIWTAKEAALKAQGTGLLFPPETIAVELDDSSGKVLHDPSLAALQIRRLAHPALLRHSAFVCSTHQFPDLKYHIGLQVP